MRRPGLYIQRTDYPGLRDAIAAIRPGVFLVHVQDRDFLTWLRGVCPNALVIGRFPLTPQEQDRYIDSDDPEGTANSLASAWLGHDGGIARLCNALMLFNEAVSGPDVSRVDDPLWQKKCAHYDRMQVAFQRRLRAEGMESCGGNFGAGNWPDAASLQRWFPLSLGADGPALWGFHIYGQRSITAAVPDWHSNVSEVFNVMEGLTSWKPGRFRGVVTEAGVSRAYADVTGQNKDTGWLTPGHEVEQGSYAADLALLYTRLCQKPWAEGVCFFGAAMNGDWDATFRLLGKDNAGRPLLILQSLASLPDCNVSPTPPTPTPVPPMSDPVVSLRLPFDGVYPLSQGFGEHPKTYRPFGLPGHEGLDYPLPYGTPVLACDDGEAFSVMAADPGDHKRYPYGIKVHLLHSWGQSVYGHLSRVNVKDKDKVKRGQVIGWSGNSGNSTGPHLHWGIRLKDYQQNDGWLGYTNPHRFLPATIGKLDEGKIAKLREQLNTLSALTPEMVATLNDLLRSAS